MLPDAIKTEDDPGEADPRPVPRDRRRGLPAWQVIAAAVIVLVAVVGLCQISGLASRLRPLATATPSPTPVPTATEVPTAAATETATATVTVTPTPVAVIMPGGQVVVKGTEGQQLSLRDGPSVNKARLRVLEEGTVLKVLEGPQAADGFQWWKVQTSDGVIGWVAGNWLVPVAP